MACSLPAPATHAVRHDDPVVETAVPVAGEVVVPELKLDVSAAAGHVVVNPVVGKSKPQTRRRE